MKWWPMIGLSKVITEEKDYNTDSEVKAIDTFKKSLYIFIIDVGNSNRLNFELRALHTPKYNIHRYGMYFVASPKHADLAIILGRPTKKMVAPLMETINLIPKPFGIMLIKGDYNSGIDPETLGLPNVVSVIDGEPEPFEILANLLKIMKRVD